ncbi:MAG: hypothetical protein HY898_12450 [Deltaproteobacteria bacterium]|nr:hypothetical protein [Deltaproteobacteria bacterium]
MTHSPRLAADDWRRVLMRLAGALHGGSPAHMTVIGGAAIALLFDARRTTTDVDVVIDSSDTMRVLAEARSIAAEFGLPENWLNQDARTGGFIQEPLQLGQTLIETPDLTVSAPTIEHLLATKLPVARRGDTDIEDCLVLTRRLRATSDDADDLWSRIGGLVPVAHRQNALYNLRWIWEILDERP